ncbi:imidazoleglycerol-phosphate dehydratase HisB [Chlamydiota bacterium]
MRKADAVRKTKETDIQILLAIDGSGNASIDTGIGFFDHMLELFSKHGLFDLSIKCAGDIHVDEHHTVEDIGIVLGDAFRTALGKKEKIKRYGCFQLPMDESLAEVSLDISGRPYLHYAVSCRKKKTGTFDLASLKEFFQAFAMSLKMTLHIRVVYGDNAHHIYEAVFKAFAKALDMATSIDERQRGIPSTKGIL